MAVVAAAAIDAAAVTTGGGSSSSFWYGCGGPVAAPLTSLPSVPMAAAVAAAVIPARTPAVAAAATAEANRRTSSGQSTIGTALRSFLRGGAVLFFVLPAVPAALPQNETIEQGNFRFLSQDYHIVSKFYSKKIIRMRMLKYAKTGRN